MSELCDCGTALRTLGTAACPALISPVYKWVFTPQFKADGTANELDLSADPTLNAAYFAALQIASADKPWIVSPRVMNFENTRAEAKMETFNNDTEQSYVMDGMKVEKGIWRETPANLSDTIKGWNCTPMVAFAITQSGQLLGMEGSGYKKLRGIKISLGSFYSSLVQNNNVTIGIQKTMVQFTWDSSECDKNLKMIAPSSFAVGYDIKQLAGLIQVDFKPHLANTATTVKVAADTNQGYLTTPVLVTGLVVGDFVVTNRTTGVVITPSGLTEISGLYVITYASQTGNLLSLACTKTGYQFATYNYTSN